MSMAQGIFWGAALLLVHTYFLYPLGLVSWDWAKRRIGRAPRCPPRLDRDALPSVSLVVAAHDEEDCIAEKVRNSLALDYPADRFELLVGSDGSTDGTDAAVRAAVDPRVRLHAAPRAGKASVLNRCIPLARGEIIVLSDANTAIDPDALLQLVRHFADPEVGAVCGRLQLYNPTLNDYEESAYWAYESRIKECEGQHGAVMGANGGLYAIRRRLFTCLPASTIVDDFVIPMRILEAGYRVTYEAEALAREQTTEDYGLEFGRRARIAAGNFQSLTLVPGLLDPRAGFAAFAFWSHKVLRWCAPALMAATLAANAALLDQGVYRLALVGQVTFYALAAVGRAGILGGTPRRIASVAYFFVTMNWAIAVGFWRFVRRTQSAAWERTARA